MKTKFKKLGKREVVEYVVVGAGHFPIDMLRYDCAWPADGGALARVDHAAAGRGVEPQGLLRRPQDRRPLRHEGADHRALGLVRLARVRGSLRGRPRTLGGGVMTIEELMDARRRGVTVFEAYLGTATDEVLIDELRVERATEGVFRVVGRFGGYGGLVSNHGQRLRALAATRGQAALNLIAQTEVDLKSADVELKRKLKLMNKSKVVKAARGQRSLERSLP